MPFFELNFRLENWEDNCCCNRMLLARLQKKQIEHTGLVDKNKRFSCHFFPFFSYWCHEEATIFRAAACGVCVPARHKRNEGGLNEMRRRMLKFEDLSLLPSALHPPSIFFTPSSFSSSTSSKHIVRLLGGMGRAFFYSRGKGLDCCSPLVLFFTDSVGIVKRKIPQFIKINFIKSAPLLFKSHYQSIENQHQLPGI